MFLSTTHTATFQHPAVMGTTELCGPTTSGPLLNAGWAANHQEHEPSNKQGTRNSGVHGIWTRGEAFGLPERVLGIKPYHRFISRKGDDMTTQHHQVITKIPVSAAIALGSCLGGAAPASANPIPTDPNPFGALSCSCRETAPPGSPAPGEEVERGIRNGLSAWLPGLPPATQPVGRMTLDHGGHYATDTDVAGWPDVPATANEAEQQVTSRQRLALGPRRRTRAREIRRQRGNPFWLCRRR
jgi:hypothetical protein